MCYVEMSETERTDEDGLMEGMNLWVELRMRNTIFKVGEKVKEEQFKMDFYLCLSGLYVMIILSSKGKKEIFFSRTLK